MVWLPDWLAPLPLPLPLPLPVRCESLLWCWVSSSESGTSTNRAVGLGPEFEGPLGFFRIGWAGGGLDEDGVRLACASLS